MKISYLRFSSEVYYYIKNNYLDVHIILPHGYQGNLGSHEVSSFYENFMCFQYQTVAELALHLMKSSFNYQQATYLVDLLMSEVNPEYKIVNSYILELIKKKSEHYQSLLKKYIKGLVSSNRPVIIVGFTKNHPLVDMMIKEQIFNCEITFFRNFSQDCVGDDKVMTNRLIFYQNPENWHKISYPAIEGIQIIECDSEEQEVIKKLVKDYPNHSLFIDDLNLLQKLEISVPDFMYEKPIILDFVITVLLRILEENLSEELLTMPFVRDGLDIKKLKKEKKLIFRDVKSATEFINAHIRYFTLWTEMELGLRVESFVKLLKGSDLEFTSLLEYKKIFSFLASSYSFSSPRVKAITDINLNNNVVIIFSHKEGRDLNFFQLLNVKKIFIVHNRNQIEPEWLIKLKILLKPKNIISYEGMTSCNGKSDSSQKFIDSAFTPDISARPKVLSATMVETLIRDPYAFYLRYILKLKPAISEEMNFGILIHKILERYGGGPGDYNLFLGYGREELEDYSHIPQAKSLWWPKLKQIGKLFVKKNQERVNFVEKVEVELKLEFQLSGYSITVTCDRVEYLTDGSIAIIECKTGSLPSTSDIESGLSPQLLLQAIAVDKVLNKIVSELSYWQLKPAGILEKKITNIEERINDTKVMLNTLLEHYPITKFHPTGYYKFYQHLARTEEIF